MRSRLTCTRYFVALFLTSTLILSFIYVPIAASQDSEKIKAKLKELQGEVSALPLDEGFETGNIHAAEGKKNALVNKVKAVIHQIEAGAYEGAINKLENDLINTITAWVNDGYEGPLIEKINEIINLIKGFPVAAFSFKPETPTVGEVVTFNASASYDLNGYIVSYVWDFGDGTNDNGMVVDHIYLTEGTFTVVLTVTDNDGLSDTAKADVRVSPVEVHDIAVISVVPSPTTVVSGQTVTISVTIENQGDFAESFSVTAFYDDNVIDTQTVTSLAADTSTILTYVWVTTDVSEGVYTISANATVVKDEVDIDDNTYIDNTVTVVSPPPHPPVASLTFSPTTPYTGQEVTFDASSSYDPDGTIESYTWSFGDGTTGDGQIVTHSYDDNGTYAVELTVVDNDGLTDIESESITVLNKLPVASFTESAETVDTAEIIYFNASDSYDPDGYIVTYFWTFGDGTNATGVIVTHAYTDDGTYVVTLIVTDNDDATASSTATKTVLNRPPVASFTESALTVFAGEVIQFNASDSYDPDGSIVSYTWDFGDDNITTTSTPMINHTYTTPGTYDVALTVTDDDGLTDDEVKAFTVEEAPWPLWLIVAIILLILAASATAIYLTRKWRKKEQGVSGTGVENYKLTILLCL